MSCTDFVNVLKLSDLNHLEYVCVCECVIVFISEYEGEFTCNLIVVYVFLLS